MSINQAIVSSNIRGLQSRTHRRGVTLAVLESRRAAVKTAIKALRNIGYPVGSDLLDNRDLLNKLVKDAAVSQTLDRQLLKQQYVLQGFNRVPKAAKRVRPNRDPRKTFAVGDVIVAGEGGCGFFAQGAKGTLVRLDPNDGQWQVDFRHPDNAPGSYDPDCNGTWWVCTDQMTKV